MTSVLNGSFYTAARGGHAPGDLREAFGEALDAFSDWNDGDPEPMVEIREQQVPIGQVFGLLWNCSDILPSIMWNQLGLFEDALGMPKRRTYGAAARWLKAKMQH